MRETTTIILTIEVTGKTEQEVLAHFEDMRDEIEALFEIDLTSTATLSDPEIRGRSL